MHRAPLQLVFVFALLLLLRYKGTGFALFIIVYVRFCFLVNSNKYSVILLFCYSRSSTHVPTIPQAGTGAVTDYNDILPADSLINLTKKVVKCLQK